MGKLRTEGKPVFNLFEDLFTICQFGFLNDVENKWFYKKYSDYIKEIALDQVVEDKKNAKAWRQMYWNTLKLETLWFFESYLLYMEHKRAFEKRFYEPRAMTLKTVVDDLQELEDDPTSHFYGLSLPARVGKSTMIMFFLSWVILKKPLSHNAIGTHSGVLARHFFKELMDIFTTDEYCFRELYYYIHPPESKFIVDKSADELTISFEQKGDFPTIVVRGIDGTWTGAVDVSSDGYLCVDDLVRDRTHSLSPKRMEDTFSEYLNKMCDRTNDGAKQLMIGTLWNVMDPLMRLESMFGESKGYKFRKIPALNENNESNFQYKVKGFSTEYYLNMKDRLIRSGDESFWMAKYQQAPYVREGLLFPHEDIRWFNGVLSNDHKYSYVCVCDVAFGGGDSVSMPIALQNLDTLETYIVDWYFSSAGVKITVPGVCDMIMKHGIMNVTFERNSGGLLYAKLVQEELNKRNYICSVDTKPAPNNIEKVMKIKGYEGIIKAKVLFLDNTKQSDETFEDDSVQFFKRDTMYERALDEFTTFVTIGKNPHDDAADSIAQLCEKIYGDLNGLAEVEVFDRAAIGF